MKTEMKLERGVNNEDGWWAGDKSLWYFPFGKQGDGDDAAICLTGLCRRFEGFKKSEAPAILYVTAHKTPSPDRLTMMSIEMNEWGWCYAMVDGRKTELCDIFYKFVKRMYDAGYKYIQFEYPSE